MVVMDMVDLATAMARGPLMLRLTMAPTVLATAATAMAATAMGDSDTDTERGPLTPMLTMAATAMAATAMVVSDTATARGPLMLTTEATAMAATAMVVLATAMASNLYSKDKIHLQNPIPDLNLLIRKLNSNVELKKLKYTQ